MALLIARRFSSAAICRADGKWASSARIGRIRSASSPACTAGQPYDDRRNRQMPHVDLKMARDLFSVFPAQHLAALPDGLASGRG